MRGKCLKFLVAIIVLDLSSVELEWKLYVFWGHSCHCFFCIFACGPCVQFSTGLDRSYALVFKLSLWTFLFLLFLNEVVNAFFTACNYKLSCFFDILLQKTFSCAACLLFVSLCISVMKNMASSFLSIQVRHK